MVTVSKPSKIVGSNLITIQIILPLVKRNPYPPPPHTAFCSSKGILAITYRVITCNIHSTPSCSRTQKHIPQSEQMCRSPTCNVHSTPCSTAQKHIITTNAQTTHLVHTFNSFMFNNSTETHNWDKCARCTLARLIQLFTFKHMQLEQKHRSPTCKLHSTASSEMQCKLGQKKLRGRKKEKKKTWDCFHVHYTK